MFFLTVVLMAFPIHWANHMGPVKGFFTPCLSSPEIHGAQNGCAPEVVSKKHVKHFQGLDVLNAFLIEAKTKKNMGKTQKIRQHQKNQ